MNYTKPNNKNYKDKPEDWLFYSLIFTRTLSFLLNENEGVLIDLKGDMLELHPELSRVIVFNNGEQIEVIEASERTDLNEGDIIQMIDDKNIKN